MAMRRQRGELAFSDDPMFKRVMQREDICKGVLSRILGRPIGAVAYHNTEQERRLGIGGKAIRMDSYLVESDGCIFDVEMQVGRNPALPRRFRGYQSVLDGSMLLSGTDYSDLTESYIVFVCLSDPFGANLPVYTLERVCLEQNGAAFASADHWIALNASAYKLLGSRDPLGALLRYIYTNEVAEGDDLLESIDAEVSLNNADKEWAMTMIDSITIAEQEARIKYRRIGREEGRQEGRQEGRKEGVSEGEGRYAKLAEALMDAGRLDDLRAANVDVDARRRLYEELGI